MTINKLFQQLTQPQHIVVFGIGLFISLSMTLLLNTPTHALSLDLSGITNIVKNVPVVNQVTAPLLSSPTVTTPTVQVPVVGPMQTPQSVTSNASNSMTPLTSAPAATTTPQATVVTSVPSNMPLRTTTKSFKSINVPNFSTEFEEAAIISAPSHIASPSVVYPTRSINPATANILFYTGVMGLIIGGAYMFLTRSRLGTA